MIPRRPGAKSYEETTPQREPWLTIRPGPALIMILAGSTIGALVLLTVSGQRLAQSSFQRGVESRSWAEAQEHKAMVDGWTMRDEVLTASVDEALVTLDELDAAVIHLKTHNQRQDDAFDLIITEVAGLTAWKRDLEKRASLGDTLPRIKRRIAALNRIRDEREKAPVVDLHGEVE